jgi:hypothetical protein
MANVGRNMHEKYNIVIKLLYFYCCAVDLVYCTEHE